MLGVRALTLSGVLVLGTLTTACSGSAVDQGGTPQDAASSSDVPTATDTANWDVAVDPAPDTVSPTDIGKGDGASAPDDDVPAGDDHGFGAPCETGDDCFSGLCAEHMGDTVCTKTCDNDCPPGWSCEQVTGASGDPIFICVSSFEHLCRPCLTGDDCTSATSEAVCIDYDGQGAFCGAGCVADGDCPEGFVCQASVSTRGGSSSQCVAASGVCDCSALAVSLGLATSCSITTAAGTCEGLRTCSPDGLTDCDAATPVEESCNGVDDDCNGETDDVSCDDDNPCTVDSCEGEAGCLNTLTPDVACDDGDLATRDDVCTAEGQCAGEPFECPQAACILEATPNGADCDVTYAELGAACDDGDVTTKDDQCDGQEGCAGTPYTCDPSQCEASSVHDGTGCAVEHWAAETPCDDGDLGTKDDQCDGSGGCFGTEYTCEPTQCEATSAPDGAGCVPTHKVAGIACDDGDPGTKSDQCDGAGGCAGTVYTCEPAQCEATSVPNGVGCDVAYWADDHPCDDGDPSTVGDLCDGTGGCAGTPYTCAPGLCELASAPNGVDCDVTYATAGAACDDGDSGTLSDQCDAVGGCEGTPYACIPDQCEVSSMPNGFDCDVEYAPVGLPCDDGDAATKDDLCDGNGACVGEAYGCAPTQCEAASEPDGDGCAVSYAAPGVDCDDGDDTTQGDQCDGAGGCAGTPYECVPTQCELQSVPDGEGCVIQYAPASVACDDGDDGTKIDVCDGFGDCVGQPYTCEADQCDAASLPNGVDCTVVPKAPGLGCDDGDPSTTGDVCDGASGCAGEPYTCEPGLCEAASEPDGQGCVVTYTPASTACDDGQADTKIDVCDGAGGCAGEPYTCAPGLCETASEPDGEGCVVTYAEGGVDCDDQDPATVHDACDGTGGCAGVPTVCGDGVTEGLEGCDDANTETEACAYGQASCVVCTAACVEAPGVVTGYCGDEVVQSDFGEMCDDANVTDGDGCSSTCQLESAGVDCAAVLLATPTAPSGTYIIDPDGPGGADPFEVHCDMTTDGGGWTRLFVAQTANYNATDIDYTVTSLPLREGADEAMIAYVDPDDAVIDSQARFPMPEAWVLQSPMQYSAEDLPVTATVGGVALGERTLRFGTCDYQSACCAPWGSCDSGWLHGRVCICDTDAPYWGFWAGPDASYQDACGFSDEDVGGGSCEETRRFSILVRRSICGNTVVEHGEVCDDGNDVAGDGCSGACTIDCPPGSGVTAAGCAPCLPGTASPGGASPCETCPLGTESNAGAVECFPCAVGQYGVGGGNCINCAPCAPGQVRDGCGGPSGGTCEPCPEGTYKEVTGQWDTPCDDCQTCEQGLSLDGCGGASAGACVCTPGFDPTAIGSTSLPGSAVCVDVQAETVYVAGQGAGLQVLDVTDPTAPTVLGSVSLDGSPKAVQVVGDIAYVAAHAGGLQIVNVSDPTNPTLLGQYATPNYTFDVHVVGTMAYLAEWEHGLTVIDVSVPSNPVQVGHYDPGPIQNGVFAVGTMVYTSDYYNGMRIVDASDPSNLVEVGSYDNPDGLFEDIKVSDGIAYLVDWSHGLRLIDVSEPSSPTELSMIAFDGSTSNVRIVGHLALVTNWNTGLYIVDVSDPTAPTEQHGIATPGNARGVALSGGHIYVADNSADLHVIAMNLPCEGGAVCLEGDCVDCEPGSAPGPLGLSCAPCPEGTYGPDGVACLPCTACEAGESLVGCDESGPGECIITVFAIDCAEVHEADPTLPSGHYDIDPDGDGDVEPFTVYCDMDSHGGGWTLLGQSRAECQGIHVMTDDTSINIPCHYLEVSRVNALAAVSSEVLLQADLDGVLGWESEAKSTNSLAVEALQTPSGTWHNGATWDNWNWGNPCHDPGMSGWPNMYHSACVSDGVHWYDFETHSSTHGWWDSRAAHPDEGVRSVAWVRRAICGNGVIEGEEMCEGAVGSGTGCDPETCEPKAPESCAVHANGDRVYLICETKANWNDARTECEGYGAEMLKIEDAAERDWLYTTANIQPLGYWSDGTDASSEGTWYDGDGDPVPYISWCGPEPNGGGNENCLQQYWSGHNCANDSLCDAEHHVACEFTFYADEDGDGVSGATDCDDADPTVYPGAPEIVGSGVDANCDGCKLVERPGALYTFCDAEPYLSWLEAEADCQARGAHLVVIDDAEEYAFIDESAESLGVPIAHVSLGLDDRNSEGNWQWATGVSGYATWAPGEPSGGTGENCVTFDFRDDLYPGDAQGYRDFPCDGGGPYACEVLVTECGNGIVEGDEDCDDNNTDDGDGCSATCEDEQPACDPVVYGHAGQGINNGWTCDTVCSELGGVSVNWTGVDEQLAYCRTLTDPTEEIVTAPNNHSYPLYDRQHDKHMCLVNANGWKSTANWAGNGTSVYGDVVLCRCQVQTCPCTAGCEGLQCGVDDCSNDCGECPGDASCVAGSCE